MNLKNYTSEVPAFNSITRIEKVLVEAGATDISKKYDNGVCKAIRFRMLVNQSPLFFELPARVEACFNVLWAEVKKPISGTKERTIQQAERTAWKIISDWVEIQIAMIKLEQAELLQVFLPYVFDPVKEKTFYSQMKEGGFKALLPPVN
jgi:hypothetical protein